MSGESQSGIFLNFSKAEGRWSRLGSYYAMFPVTFAENVISTRTDMGQTVIDPFCGRGTAPFVAMGMGRNAVGCDINPVAWLYSQTKINPHPVPSKVVERITQVSLSVRADEEEPEHEFQQLAFCPRVLGFIRAARRTLDWRRDRLDRTVMTFLVHHLHDKIGSGLSNQLRHSRAMSPRYSINWWRRKGYDTAPEIDPRDFLIRRVQWRYAKGIAIPHSGLSRPVISLGNGAVSLPETAPMANLILTSPPYSGVTNYRSDNWLRLWAMGEGPSLPDWDPEQKFNDIDNYVDMLRGVFAATAKRARTDSTWYVRSDARAKTKDAIQSVLDVLLPNHQLEQLEAPYKRKTQTALYGDHEPKPGEVDLIYTPMQ
ncbi:MAG: DNA methyltransferase [Dehalococcoidia bacterium]|nr:DNA methyltransferase [Dehalococcoidia bacterium]